MKNYVSLRDDGLLPQWEILLIQRFKGAETAVLDPLPAHFASDNEFKLCVAPNTYYSFGAWADEGIRAGFFFQKMRRAEAELRVAAGTSRKCGPQMRHKPCSNRRSWTESILQKF